MERDERYPNLERLRRDADDLVGVGYDVVTGLSFLVWWMVLWFGGLLAANKMFGGDAPDVLVYALLPASGALLIWTRRWRL